MKIRVTMKTPQALDDAVVEAIARQPLGLHSCEKEYEKVMKLARKWFRWEESVTLEIDTEAQTCTVVPN